MYKRLWNNFSPYTLQRKILQQEVIRLNVKVRKAYNKRNFVEHQLQELKTTIEQLLAATRPAQRTVL